MDLDVIFDDTKCESFGSAYLKSRSSDSFTSALKDYIAPVPVNLTNCGTVIIRKQTNPEESPNSTNFGFTKSFATDPSSANTFTLQDDGVKTFNNVLLGSGYTVAETTVPAGWEFQGVDCSASTGVTPSSISAGGTVTFAIDATSDILDCTYTNRAYGYLKLVKNTTGGNGTFAFTHTIDGLLGSLTTVSGTAEDTSNAIAPGSTYAVAEGTLPAGFDFTSASCKLEDGTTATGTVDGKSITGITVEAGKTTTCTFSNTAFGYLKLVKNTTGGNGTFPFTNNATGLATSLTTVAGTANDTSDKILPGAGYAVAEGTLPAGFDFTSASCKLEDGTTATGTVDGKSITGITVEAGKTTTCTFSNTAFGYLKLVKNTTGGNGTFPFTNNATGLATSLTTVAGTANDTSDKILPGAGYAVAEGTLPAGFDFTSASCKLEDGTTATGTVDGKSITGITVEAGKTTTCTFSNTAFGYLKLVKNTTGGNGTFPFTNNATGLATSLTTVAGTANDTSDKILPGAGYAVAEGTLPAGFDFTSASCKLEDGTTATGTVDGKSITGITVEAGKTTTCTFNNEALYRTIVLVCNEVTNELHASTVYRGADDEPTIAAPPTLSGYTVDLADLEAYLCGLDSGRFTGLSSSPDPGYDLNVRIPHPQ